MNVPTASSPDGRACDALPPQTLKICVLLPEVETAISSLQCALAVARGFAPLICAVHVGFDPQHSFVSAEEQDIQQLRDIYEGKPAVRAARIKAAVEAFLAAEPDAPPIPWKNDEGDICANIVLEACRADLLVIGRPIHLDASDALHSALFDVRRLVLIAPRDAADPDRTIGRHMVIGWKPGEAIRHSVEAAAAWLRRADKVSVLCVAKPGAEPYEPSARAFFDKLGVAAEIIGLTRTRQSVGGQILAEAMRRGGDCLVIGAFRHNSLWEAMLGGVTRDVLGHADMPVFLMR